MAIANVQGEGQQAAAISRLVVETFAAFTGRGPVSARTSMGGHSIHVVLLDVLSKSEKNLVEAGNSAVVLASRRAIQDGVSATLTTGVEAITGRTVVAFLSANHIGPDIGIESFILGPVRST